MATITKNERLTKTYVDNAVEVAMDAQRQYSETLFSKADKRVQALIDEKLKMALSIIRPVTDIEPTTVEMPHVSRQNKECLSTLRGELIAAVIRYERATGLHVRCAYFDTAGLNGSTVKLLVHNV